MECQEHKENPGNKDQSEKKDSPEKVRVGRSDWALVDPDIAVWARKYNWYRKEGCAVRFDDEGYQWRMHREIMQANPERKVIHRNGNLLDNRRENLVVTTNLAQYNRENYGKDSTSS